METKYLGAPHCRVECYDDYWGDCTNIDPAESGKDYALVWADGEDSAAIPVVGDLTADMVVVNGGDAAAFLESVVIEDDALFKGSFGSNECDCGCATDDADRKWIVVRIKRSRLCSVPVSFSVGLKGLNEVRRFWVVPESWDWEEALEYIENYGTKESSNMEDRYYNGWYGGGYPYGGYLTLKYGANGAVTTAYSETEGGKATATGSAQLVPYDVDGNITKAWLYTALKPRGRDPFGLLLFLSIDTSNGNVYGDDVVVDDYLLEVE